MREIYIKSEYNDMSENSGMFFRKKKNGKRRMEKEESRKETRGEFSVKTFLEKQAEHFFLGIVYL